MNKKRYIELKPSQPLGHVDSVTVPFSSGDHSSWITDHVAGNKLWLRVVQAEMFRPEVVVCCRFRCIRN